MTQKSVGKHILQNVSLLIVPKEHQALLYIIWVSKSNIPLQNPNHIQIVAAPKVHNIKDQKVAAKIPCNLPFNDQ